MEKEYTCNDCQFARCNYPPRIFACDDETRICDYFELKVVDIDDAIRHGKENLNMMTVGTTSYNFSQIAVTSLEAWTWLKNKITEMMNEEIKLKDDLRRSETARILSRESVITLKEVLSVIDRFISMLKVKNERRKRKGML